MRDEPGGRDLLETARAALVAEVLPQLSGDARYAGAMIANALRMVLGEGEDSEAEREALRGLLGCGKGEGISPLKHPLPNGRGRVPPPPPCTEEGVVGLGELNSFLSAAIRAGRFDPGTEQHSAMRAALMSMTVERLALANPKALEAERASGVVSVDFVPWVQS